MVQLNPGDVAYAPDGEEHWHGARTDHFMTHLSITDGAAHWGSHVTDHEYQGLGEPARAGPSPRRPGSRTQTDPGTKSAPFGKDPRSGILASWGPRLGQVPAAPPHLGIEKVRRFCAKKVPDALTDEVRLEVTTRRRSVSIHERRLVWRGAPGERSSVAHRPAPLRGRRKWTLSFGDHNGKWVLYFDLAPRSRSGSSSTSSKTTPPASSGARSASSTPGLPPQHRRSLLHHSARRHPLGARP